ncbi:hypothetical protein EV426DRAFT_645581 [Tirmania nivea]|nr:hypothetical protein EV426DRAFT_645581 [Tirmania nivea]
MKFTLSLVVLAIGVLSTAVSAQTKYPFRLRAWRDTRFGNPLPLSIYVELDPTTGDAIINKTAEYPGFESYLDPTPEEGTLHKNGTGEIGYLFPLHSMSTDLPHYQLRYSRGIPKIAGVLWQNFTTVGRGCGAMCGGATLDYDIGGNRGYGEWYIFPKKKDADGEKCKRNVWYLRWIGVKYQNQTVVIPDGGYSVYLWKN